MNLLSHIESHRQVRAAQHLQRHLRTTESPNTPVRLVDNRELLSFCSNDYLGLANHTRICTALKEGVDRYGVGSGASHLISGHSLAHARLEECLAQDFSAFLTNSKVLYFSTGYMANLSLLTALTQVAGKGDTTIFSERLNHASLIDGTRLSGAQLELYSNENLLALEDVLRTCASTIKLIVTVSVFSMDGRLAALPKLLELCEQYDAWLVIDDAHGFGVLGQTGLGVLQYFKLASRRILYMGTLGKAAGVSGAFVAAQPAVIDWLIQSARPYIYSTASAPALAHALLTSLEVIKGEEGIARRAHLQNLVVHARNALAEQGWRLTDSATAIQPILLEDNVKTLFMAEQLQEAGFWLAPIRPPTVPEGTSRLRLTLSAAHTFDHLDQLLSVLGSLRKKYEVRYPEINGHS